MTREEIFAILEAIRALGMAEQQFTFYAEEHRKKGSEEKAATNYGYATLVGSAYEHLKLKFPDCVPTELA